MLDGHVGGGVGGADRCAGPGDVWPDDPGGGGDEGPRDRDGLPQAAMRHPGSALGGLRRHFAHPDVRLSACPGIVSGGAQPGALGVRDARVADFFGADTQVDRGASQSHRDAGKARAPITRFFESAARVGSARQGCDYEADLAALGRVMIENTEAAGRAAPRFNFAVGASDDRDRQKAQRDRLESQRRGG